MLCVSEYLPNGNLEVAIRKDRERKDGKPRLLGWYMQGRPIAVDVARGLAFLHTHKARAPAYPKPCWATYIGVRRLHWQLPVHDAMLTRHVFLSAAS